VSTSWPAIPLNKADWWFFLIINKHLTQSIKNDLKATKTRSIITFLPRKT
jgi:hypothetical protein